MEIRFSGVRVALAQPPAQARECCYRSYCTTHYPVPDGPYLKTYVNLMLAPAGARIKLTYVNPPTKPSSSPHLPKPLRY